MTRDKLTVAGFIPSSMTDWPDHICSVVFLSGCNLDCFYCHNAQLKIHSDNEDVTWDEVLAHVGRQRKWIDHVTITGGEPTINPDLMNILQDLRSEDVAVNLHTNGLRPDVLKTLIEGNWIQRVSMDIKTSVKKYQESMIGCKQPYQRIQESVSLVLDAYRTMGLEHEFRTTLVAELTEEEDILEIAQMIQGAKEYHLQRVDFNTENNEQVSKHIISTEKARAYQLIASQFVPTFLRNY